MYIRHFIIWHSSDTFKGKFYLWKKKKSGSFLPEYLFETCAAGSFVMREREKMSFFLFDSIKTRDDFSVNIDWRRFRGTQKRPISAVLGKDSAIFQSKLRGFTDFAQLHAQWLRITTAISNRYCSSVCLFHFIRRYPKKILSLQWY